MQAMTPRKKNDLVLQIAYAIAQRIVTTLTPAIPNSAYIVQTVVVDTAQEVLTDHAHIQTAEDVETYKLHIADTIYAAIRNRVKLQQADLIACTDEAIARWQRR